MRAALARREYYRKQLPDAVPYAIYFSESGAFPQIGFDQAELAEGAQRMGAKVFAHGFGANTYWSSSIQDMQSTTSIERFDGDTWHAGGGEVINYAYPFPGPENPEHFRRLCGFDQYKAGRHIPRNQARRGDLIFYGPGGGQHVTMYLGGGKMLEASGSAGKVVISPVRTSGMTPFLTRIIEY